MIVWGTKLYGKVDAIKDLGFVATQFWHFCWIPLVPTNTYFVTHEEGWRFEGIPLGLQWKSVLAGYGRVFSFLFLFAGLAGLNAIYGVGNQFEPEKINSYRLMFAMGVLSIPLGIATLVLCKGTASYDDAQQLANQLQFDATLRAHIDLVYGKITQEQAEEQMGDAGVDAYEPLGEDDGEGELVAAAGDGDLDPEIAAAYRRYMST